MKLEVSNLSNLNGQKRVAESKLFVSKKSVGAQDMEKNIFIRSRFSSRYLESKSAGGGWTDLV